ncbi:transcription elongation regulator-like protein [Leptomonas pyrrhocoris]|uniref:Transcription elongation regulator-like protein n=1 Tax=Leptomonas pyrrhocoris TaxID=157538 RepID=A0A0N0VGX4_LEPPY|nr:transcription elongation regulator-like protein [Leptomonas pyrrhocoris]KPA84214.1 transcription elongation regulator-like protein [Leptomonas pyrrhocoris]|eukprot:XP_015662653.1 transcription elongation regulator-like protein [Leptomonas pyrrhocoris]
MADEDVNYDELADLLASNSVVGDKGHEKGDADAAEKPRKEKNKKKHKKSKRDKKKRSRDEDGDASSDDERVKSKYVLDAAESGDSDGEDELSDADFVADDEEVEDVDYGERPKPYLFHEGDDKQSVDELARYYEEADRHYRKHGDTNDAMLTQGDLSSRRLASQFLPREDDPKVFAVKCRPRMARVLVTRIVNKCYAYRAGHNYERKKVDLGIISVFALDHVKEYIYVEASRKRFVENVLNGLDGVFRFNIAVVDPKELLQTMETRPSTLKVRVGDFVRLRQRFYRGDLAQVTALHPDGVHITCKVVPREDFVQKSFNKPTKRLPPRFFAPRLAVGVREMENAYVWGDLHFDRDGYLLKSVSTRMVVSGVQLEQPSTEELARFYNNQRDKVERAIRAAEAAAQVPPISIGDSVRVTSGQLRNTLGVVENIFTNTSTAVLTCAVPGRAQPIKVQVELTACTKHFSEGAHVVVERGEHTGESGTVVKSWGSIVLLFPDRAAVGVELKVEANDCHQSKLGSVSTHTNGVWQLFDLVSSTEANCVGCIVRLNRNDVDVLTENNDVRTLSYAQVKAVGRDARQTTDRRKNILSRGVEVMIDKHPMTPIGLEGQTGRIEHVFHRTLFVRCRASPLHANMVALDADCVLLLGGRKTNRRVAPALSAPAAMNAGPYGAAAARLSAGQSRDSEIWDESSVMDVNFFPM